jgi:tetratricopeptide (TPR) repeat protein
LRKTKRPLATKSPTNSGHSAAPPVRAEGPAKEPPGRIAARTSDLRRRANAPSTVPHARRKKTWLGLIIGALAIFAGVLIVHPWAPLRGTSHGETASSSLPDAPSVQEQALLTQAGSARSKDATPARLLGDYYASADRPFAALWAYSLALQAQPADVPASLGMAGVMEQARFLDAAISRLRQVLARQPGQPQAAAQLAKLYLLTGRPKAALPVVQGAGAAFTSRKDGAVLEGRVRQALGDAAGAKAAYMRAARQDASDADVQHRIGVLALSRGEIAAAQQAFGAARRLEPANPRYDVDLGRAYAASSKREDWLRAPDLYAAAMSRDARYEPAHYEAGVWFQHQSRWREAIERLRMAVDLRHNDADAHERLAQALQKMGRAAEAHQHRGMAYAARSLRIAALREFQAWAALDPDNPKAPFQIAQTYVNIGRTNQARACLEKACRRFPRDTTLRERLIAFDLLSQDPAAARRLCEEWRREEPGSPQVLWLLGSTAAAQQRYGEAVRFCEQALVIAPNNPLCLGTLGE